MEHNEEGQRNSAAKDFQKSLDQLQNLLEKNQTEEQPVKELEKELEKELKELEKELEIANTQLKAAAEESPKFDLAEWEDAVADIEQYFENKNKDN